MEPAALAKRYRSLWMGETVASLLFVGLFLRVALTSGSWSDWIVRTYSLGVVILILAQGVVWWRWKLRQLRAQQRTMPAEVLDWFERCKRLNWLLIGAFPVVVAFKWWLTGTLWPSDDTLFGLLFLGGAVLEQINYYYYQLMYDSRYDLMELRTHRRLRRGSIGKALVEQPHSSSLS
ncbi:MAG TPA: hypothetical protein VFS21_27560 [Roseiflexaceae bacterium]|nr:hypothetical protein [Roseiflexaceae bacterium]